MPASHPSIEPHLHGFILVDHSGPIPRYMGNEGNWREKAAGINPFATESDAADFYDHWLVEHAGTD